MATKYLLVLTTCFMFVASSQAIGALPLGEMPTHIFTVLTTFLLLLFVVTTEALSCYYCIYVDTQYHFEDLKSEDSCASGYTPLARLSFDCSTLEYRMLPHSNDSSLLGISTIDNKTERLPPLPNAVFTCATLIYDGRYEAYHDRFAVKGVFRGCLMSFQNSTISPQCHKDILKNLISTVKTAEVLDLLVDFDDELDENVTETGICSCNTNNCNVNTEVEASSGFRFGPSSNLFYSLTILYSIIKCVMGNTTGS